MITLENAEDSDLRVLQINTVASYGSTAALASGLSRCVVERGGSAALAYGRGEAAQELQCIKIGNAVDIGVHGVLSRITDRHAFFSGRATAAFLRKADRFEPDLVHLHNLHGYYLNVRLLFSWLRRKEIPVIWTLHDCWAFTGHCAHFSTAKCEKWRYSCGDCPQKKSYPKSVLVDASARNYRDKRFCFRDLDRLTLVTPSEWLAGVVRESFLGEYPIRTIHNGVDLETFSREGAVDPRFRGDDRICLLGVAGSWSEAKGLNDFYRLRQRLGDGYRIVLVGLSPRQITQLPDGIEGIGPVHSGAELASIYRGADLFLNPSYADTYPTTNLEAQACGLPVICYNIGGCRETLSDPRFAVPCGDLASLEAFITEEKWRSYCFPSTAEELGCDRAMAEYIALYESLMR